MGHGKNEVICMNYEHDNEFGQRPDGNRRNAPGRTLPPGSRRGGYGRDAQNPQAYGRDAENRGGRRASSLSGMEGTGRIASMPGATGRVRLSDEERSRAARRETAAGQEHGTERTAAGGRPPGSRGASAPNGSARAQRMAEAQGAARRKGAIPPPDGSARERATQARVQKAKQKKMRRRIISMIIAECFALIFIFTYGYFARRLTLIQREEFDPQEVGNNEISLDTIKKMKGYRMIAIFGVDSRDSNVGAGCQSDVIIICCINEDTGEIKLASVYRDTYLNINDEGSYRKVNAAYTNGGPQQALKALNKNLDLNITEYITFSWKAVAEGINILGGVDVEITKPEFKFINGFITATVEATGIGSHQLKTTGMQHLDGVQAVAYGRLRLMDTDYARTERQRKVIELAFAKAKKAEYSVLNNILVVVLPNVSTNITFADMTTMALNINKYYIGETTGFPFAKGNANMPGKGDCVIPQTLESNVKQLHTFLFGDEDYETTDQVKQISSKIAADSGMYKEGAPFKGSALSTDGYVPEETTKAKVVEKETTASDDETDEDESLTIPGGTDEDGNIINIYPGQTDENGELLDAPIDDWPEEEPSLPGGMTTRPIQPGGTQGPGNGPSVNDNNENPGTSVNPNPQGPGHQQPGTDNSGTVGPGGSVEPGGNAGTAVLPEETTSAVSGEGEALDPRGNPVSSTMPWEAGPGMTTENNNNPGPDNPGGDTPNEAPGPEAPGAEAPGP